MKSYRAAAVKRLARASGLAETRVSELLLEAEEARGEFALPCFTLAKELREAPPRIAARIAKAFEPGDGLAGARAEGPYVNVLADRTHLARETLGAVASAGEGYGGSDEGRGKTVVIDYSSPNVAKPLAFHHLPSTMIGHSLLRIYRAGGWEVVGVNHLGDWGTAFGKLLLGWELHGSEDALASLSAEALYDLYVRINAEIGEDTASDGEGLADRARAWFLRLEQGDPTARRLWQRFCDVSREAYEEAYRVLGVTFDYVWGESRYEDRMPDVIRDLEKKGVLEESEGARVVSLEDEGMPPCLIQKKDGATLYATRDLAAAIERHEVFAFDRALYVVDRGQSLHFRQLKAVLEKAGHPWAAAIRHVPFGVIRMGGKRTRTRAGGVILLLDVLEAAVEKVRALMREKNPDLEGAERISTEVGVGAVVFNQLKNRRETDVDFDLDQVVSFEGKTGPYVMYSHARACSILRRAGEALRPVGEVDPSLLADPSEWTLLRLVALFPSKVDASREKDEPSEVAKHLLDLCEAFHAYHTKGGRDAGLRVLSADPELRAARLRLTDAVRQTMANALALLGLGAPPAM